MSSLEITLTPLTDRINNYQRSLEKVQNIQDTKKILKYVYYNSAMVESGEPFMKALSICFDLIDDKLQAISLSERIPV